MARGRPFLQEQELLRSVKGWVASVGGEHPLWLEQKLGACLKDLRWDSSVGANFPGRPVRPCWVLPHCSSGAPPVVPQQPLQDCLSHLPRVRQSSSSSPGCGLACAHGSHPCPGSSEGHRVPGAGMSPGRVSAVGVPAAPACRHCLCPGRYPGHTSAPPVLDLCIDHCS